MFKIDVRTAPKAFWEVMFFFSMTVATLVTVSQIETAGDGWVEIWFYFPIIFFFWFVIAAFTFWGFGCLYLSYRKDRHNDSDDIVPRRIPVVRNGRVSYIYFDEEE